VTQGTPAELKARLLGPPLMELRYLTDARDGVRPLVARFGAVEMSGKGWVRFRPSNAAAANPLLLRALTERGVSVITLSEVPQSLELVYLRAVDEEVRDGADP